MTAGFKSESPAGFVGIRSEVRRRPRARQGRVKRRDHDALVDESGGGADRQAEDACLMIFGSSSARLDRHRRVCIAPAAGGDGSRRCGPLWAAFECDHPSLFLVA